MAEPTLGSMLAAMGSPIEYQAVNISKLYWDDANGSLGIGVSTPLATLQVARGTGDAGTACFQGTTYASHFNYSDAENTYIRGGKVTSQIIIGDMNTSGSITLGGVGSVIYTDNGSSFIIGGGGSAEIRTRHIYGKSYTSTALDDLFINYYAVGCGAQIGDAGTDHHLIVYGDIYHGTIGDWLSSILNQGVRTDNSPYFTNVTFTGIANSDGTFRVSQINSGSLYIEYYFLSGAKGVTYFVSQREAKKNIRPLELDSSVIHSLDYKHFEMKDDPTNRQQFGLVAEEVHEICPDVVAYKEDGVTPLFVRYDLIGILAAMETTKLRNEMNDVLKRVEKLEGKNG
jgi:hypothetical protein